MGENVWINDSRLYFPNTTTTSDTRSNNTTYLNRVQNLENPTVSRNRESIWINNSQICFPNTTSFSQNSSKNGNNLKQVQNPDNYSAGKNRENIWINDCQRYLPNSTSFPQNATNITSNLNSVENSKNWTWENIWINSSILKEVKNEKNITVWKSWENVWNNDSQRYLPNTTSFSQNTTNDTSNLHPVPNLENLTTVWENGENIRINASKLKNVKNPHNLTVCKNQMSVWINNSHGQVLNTSSFQQISNYSSNYNFFRPQEALKGAPQNTKFSNRLPPTWSSAIPIPLSEIQNFISKQATAQPSCTNFRLNSTNQVSKSGKTVVRRHFSTPTSCARHLDSRGKQSVRPFQSAEPDSSSILVNMRRNNVTSMQRIFYPSNLAINVNTIESAVKKYGSMPTIPNCNSFRGNKSSNDSRKSEIVEICSGKSEATSSKENIDDEVTYLFTVDSIPTSLARQLDSRGRPFQPTASDSTSIPINTRRNDITSMQRIFSPSHLAVNFNTIDSAVRKYGSMPTIPNYNSFLGNISSNDSRKSETVEMSSGKSEATSSKENKDDDVTYLFTVDTTPAGRIVTEIDLSSAEMNLGKKVQSTAVASSTRKRKLSGTNQNPFKRVNTDRGHLEPKCSACKIRYHALSSNNGTMCVARCGHVYCLPCVRNGMSECKTCGAECLSFQKLFR